MLWQWGQTQDGIIQIAFVVPDIHAAMQHYGSALQVGPWFLAEHFAFEELKYQGLPVTPDLSLCLGFSGSMMVELIQQNCTTPSPYIDDNGQPRCGFHHWGVAATPEGYQAKLDSLCAQGLPLVLQAVVGIGSRAAYVDARPTLGGMIELMEISPPVEALFTHMRDITAASSQIGLVHPFPGQAAPC